uniref:Protogenin n=1 Tax=Electrophorus electricus TaxID=8005 RepID=A0A4W4DPI8_ELEEL
DVIVLRKDAVVLDCRAQGEAPVHVRWLKNGSPFAESERAYLLANGSLFISEVENRRGDQSDEGLYQCLAQNKYGAILSQKARLTIASISTFTQQPSPIVVTEGSVARFTCKIGATPPPIITWEFNRVTLPLATDRITVLPTGVLQIQGVEQRDAGNYRCVAANIANRRRSAEAALTVTPAPFPRIPQRPRIIAGPQNVTVATHGSVLLECVAVGNPRPLISWSRADHKSIDVYNTKVLGNGNLLISDVKHEHGGVYMCRATTPGTRNYTVAVANITVLAPPSLLEWPESLTRPRAGTGRFVCEADGVPRPRITWLKNGEPIHSNGRIKMYNSKLVINQIIPEDDAIYQCLVENTQGSVLSTARLIVVMSEDRPSAPRNIRADTVSSSAVLLAWEKPLYNADKVIAYSIHYMKAEGLNNEEYQVVIGNDTARYIIDDLEPARNYTFYIVAYMPMGASRMSDHVMQHTLEDVPLRAPEMSLTSRSPTDIQVSWQPLSHKLSRGLISAYRLWYRSGSDGAATQVELPGHTVQHLLEGLQPDTVYLLRIAAATAVGWGEASTWSAHRTPRASSHEVPLAPELQLESLNCTTVAVRWRLAVGTSAAHLRGYKLFYHEESQPENAAIQLPAHLKHHTIGGLDPRKKYHIKLLAFSFLGEGYQADRTISTPGCVSVRDRLVPPPPPPHHVHARANSSSAVLLNWARPAFTGAHTINYTVRCNPVGLQNASLVLYLQTGEQSLLVKNLEANTRYEFAVRLHVDQLSSPWSPVVYQNTLPDAPATPPTGVKVTLIEGDTALVSWKPPNEANVAVTRYTILYASRKAWVTGQWQILQREGSVTMALLENLQPGNVYLVKVSASNQMGDGPFSPAVELTVNADSPASGHASGHASRSHGSAHATVFYDGFSHLDQRSITGIIGGGCIALTCILVCALILVCRGKSRKSCTSKIVRQGQSQAPPTTVHIANETQAPSSGVMVPMVTEHFIDAKVNGTEFLVLISLNNVNLFLRSEKVLPGSSCLYQPGSTLLRYTSEPGSTLLCYTGEPHMLQQPSLLHALLGSPGGDAEASHSSEGSHETGDSGRYSHDEMEMNDVPSGASSCPASLGRDESGGPEECAGHVVEEQELVERTSPPTEHRSLCSPSSGEVS